MREGVQLPEAEPVCTTYTQVNRIPEQKLPDKETCDLISTIFADLAEAHKHYANAARGLVDIAGLISPEQLTLVLAAAVLPTLQLVLQPGQISPLSTPPPPLTTATTAAGRQDMIKYCKNMILLDPAADAFKECDEHTPTQVLAAAVFCTLEKHLFDETMPRVEVASLFLYYGCTASQSCDWSRLSERPAPIQGKKASYGHRHHNTNQTSKNRCRFTSSPFNIGQYTK